MLEIEYYPLRYVASLSPLVPLKGRQFFLICLYTRWNYLESTVAL